MKRKLLCSLLTVCMAICLCFSFITANRSLTAKASLGDMTKVETAIDCTMPLEEGKVKNLTSWGYYDSDADGVADVWGFAGDGTATAQPEIRFSTPGTNTVNSSANRIYCPISVTRFTIEYNITNSGSELAESSTTKYMLQVLGATAGVGSVNAYYYHIPEIIDDGNWHTLTVTLDSVFTGGKEGLPTAETFADINDIVCCFNFKMGKDFNGEVLFRNFNLYNEVETAIESAMPLEAGKVKNITDWGYFDTDADGVADVWGFVGNGTATAQPEIRFSTPGTDTTPGSSARVYKPISLKSFTIEYNIINSGSELAESSTTQYLLQILAAYEGTASANAYYYWIPEIVADGNWHTLTVTLDTPFTGSKDGMPTATTMADIKDLVCCFNFKMGVDFNGHAMFRNMVVEENEAVIPTFTVTADEVFSNTGDVSPNGMYFRSTDEAPYDTSWSKGYKPTTADAVQFIRNGVTTNVGNTGAVSIKKYNTTHYFLEGWAVGVNSNGYQVGDVYVLNGDFYSAELNATITFVDVQLEVIAITQVEDNGVLRDRPTTAEHVPAIQAGQMKYHTGNFGHAGEYISGIHFTLPANTAPYDGWHVEYKATVEDSVTLTRNGVTTNIALVDVGTIVKFDETGYYLKLDEWMISRFGVWPLQKGDVITVGGLFVKDGVIIKIEKTSVEIFDKPVFSNDVIYNAGYGENANGNGPYFNMKANDAPYESAHWAIDYSPVDASNVKRIRDGEVTNVADVSSEGRRTIVKFEETKYYFDKIANFAVGDILVLSGYFRCNQDTQYIINLSETYFKVVEGNNLVLMNPCYNKVDHAGNVLETTGTLPYGTTIEESGITLDDLTRADDEDFAYEFKGWLVGDNAVDLSRAYEGSVNITPDYVYTAKNAIDSGYGYAPIDESHHSNFYFDLADNGAPYLDNWDLRYAPMTIDSVKRIRNGETVSIAKVGTPLIVKFNPTKYFFACEGANLLDVSVQDGDVFVLDGYFQYVDGEGVKTVIQIRQTYIHVAIEDGAKKVTILNPTVTVLDVDGNVVSKTAYPYQGNTLLTKPEDPVKTVDGYTCTFTGWYNGEELWNFDSDLVNSGDIVLAPRFEVVAIEYTATFMADGEIVDTVTYTVEGIDVPAVPAKDGYTGAWEAYDLVVGGMTVNAVYTAIEYDAVFKADGEIVDTVKYTVESESIIAPEVPAKAGYTGVWAEYELTLGGIEVNAVYTIIEYTVTFMDGETVVGTDTYTVEDTEITVPEVPAKDGYTGAWEEFELTMGDVTVNAVYTEIEESEPESTVESTVESTESVKESDKKPPVSSGCGGGLGAGSFLALAGLAAIVFIKRRNK